MPYEGIYTRYISLAEYIISYTGRKEWSFLTVNTHTKRATKEQLTTLKLYEKVIEERTTKLSSKTELQQ